MQIRESAWLGNELFFFLVFLFFTFLFSFFYIFNFTLFFLTTLFLVIFLFVFFLWHGVLRWWIVYRPLIGDYPAKRKVLKSTLKNQISGTQCWIFSIFSYVFHSPHLMPRHCRLCFELLSFMWESFMLFLASWLSMQVKLDKWMRNISYFYLY